MRTLPPSHASRRLRRASFATAALATTLSLAALAAGNNGRTGMFSGAKVNGGTVASTVTEGSIVLTLSNDFKVPDTPAPHWQVVDSKGNTYLLQRLKVKALVGEKLNKTITVPAYVSDVSKVQIWCAWAEVLLGEASFPAPVRHN